MYRASFYKEFKLGIEYSYLTHHRRTLRINLGFIQLYTNWTV